MLLIPVRSINCSEIISAVEKIVRCTALLPDKESNSRAASICTMHRVLLPEKESSGRTSFYFTRFLRCRLSIPSAGICKRRRGAFVKRLGWRCVSRLAHTKAVREKMFRRRTGNDETNFAGSVWAQIGWCGREGGAEVLQIIRRSLSIWSYFHASPE